MDSPSGRAVVLRSGGYEAEVVEVGGGLRSLRKDSHDVVAGYRPDEMCSSGRGQVLLPWPNRIRDGAYEFDATSYQLGLSEAAKRNAIHGLTRWANWQLADQSPTHAGYTYRLHPQPGYPFLVDLSIDYTLSDDGLRVDISARNAGDQRAPYGQGAHPYLTVGRRVDACELTLPASSRSEVDERGLPDAPVSVEGGPYDFRVPRLIGATSFDNPFTGLSGDGSSTTVVLRDSESGRVATLVADASYRWLQVFSGDALPTGAREALAVEPMSCPPNAFRSGVDLVILEPGETHTAGFTLA